MFVGLLPERQDAAENVPGPGQDCSGWPRDEPALRVSVAEGELWGLAGCALSQYFFRA